MKDDQRIYKRIRENTTTDYAIVSPFLFKSSKIKFLISRPCDFDVGIVRKV